MNILQACHDPKIFKPFLRGGTWDVWLVFLAALFGLPMSAGQLAVYCKYTGRTTAPTSQVDEAFLVCGRRAGKSFILALIAVFLACFKDWRPYLGPGECATIMIVARDKKQARVIKRFVTGLLKNIPMLKPLIEAETAEAISLRNNICIEIHTASFRSTRGYTTVCALLDEVAFWEISEESVEPDVEILNAIRPGMATIPNALLLAASSPHARRGALWNAYHKHFGKNDDNTLVWQAATREMNPSVKQSFIDRHIADDPARAAAEYMAQFRTDLEGYLLREVLERCVGAYFELAPTAGRSYFAFTDCAGGSGQDSFTVAVGHKEGRRVIVDCVRERKPPFSPDAVIDDFTPLLKSYRIIKVTGDRFAGGFPPEAFSKRGFRYIPSEKTKSDLYRDALAMFNSVQVTIPKNDKLITQLLSLERRIARGGHDSIDHPSGGHDDLSNAVAGCAVVGGLAPAYDILCGDSIDAPEPLPDYQRTTRALQAAGVPEMFARERDMVLTAAAELPLDRQHVFLCSVAAALTGKHLPLFAEVDRAVHVAGLLNKIAHETTGA